MNRRGAIKGNELNPNNLLAVPTAKEPDIESKSIATKTSFYDSSKVPTKIYGKNKQNMYTFKVRFSDREQVVSFPREEAMNIASEIGVDLENDQGERLWFLQQALLSELPQGWTREEDFAGRTVYYNTLTKEQSPKHPSIYKFRTAFNRILRSVALKEKLFENSALEMSNAERNVLQKRLEELDETERGKLLKTLKANVTKEQEKTAGELTKNIMRWMKEKKSKMGSSEEFPVILGGQSSYYFQSILNEIDNKTASHAVEDYTALEEALKEAYEWYHEIIPNKKISCPKHIEQTEAYQFADIEEVLFKAQEIKIDAEAEPYLLWIPRMALALPLPPFWRAKRIEDSLYYYNVERDVISYFHPDNQFMIEYTRKVREKVVDVEGRIFNTSYMNFYDSLMRDFKEAFYPLETETKNVTMNFSIAAGKYTQNFEKAESVDTESINFEERPQLPSLKIEVADREIIEIAKQCNVNFKTELYLLSTIEEALKEQKFKADEVWEFRLSSQSSPYWVSTKTKIASKKYPLLSSILEQISESKQFVQNSVINDKYRLMARIPKKLLPFSGSEGVSGLYQQLKEEANKLVSVAIENKFSEPGSPENKPYDIKKLANFIGTTLSKDEALDVLFACPFDFGREKFKVDSISEESDSNDSIDSESNSIQVAKEKGEKQKALEQKEIRKEQKELKKEQKELKKEQKEIKKEQKEFKKEQKELKKEQKEIKKEQKEFKKEQKELKKEQKQEKKEQKETKKEQKQEKKVIKLSEQKDSDQKQTEQKNENTEISAKEIQKEENNSQIQIPLIDNPILLLEQKTEEICKPEINFKEVNAIDLPQIEIEHQNLNQRKIGTAKSKEKIPSISKSNSVKSLINIPNISELKLFLPREFINIRPKKAKLEENISQCIPIESIVRDAPTNLQDKINNETPSNSQDTIIHEVPIIKESTQEDVERQSNYPSKLPITDAKPIFKDSSVGNTEQNLIDLTSKLIEPALIPKEELDIEHQPSIEKSQTPKQKEASPKQPYSIHLPKEKILHSISQSIADENKSEDGSKEMKSPSSASDSFNHSKNPKILASSEFEKFGDVSSIYPSINHDISLTSEPPQIQEKKQGKKPIKREQSNQSPEPQEATSSNKKILDTFFSKPANDEPKRKRKENSSKFHVLSQTHMRNRAKQIRAHMLPPSTMRATNGYISIKDQNPEPEVESKLFDFENTIRTILDQKEVGKLVTQPDHHYSSARLQPSIFAGQSKILYRQTDKNWNPNFPADIASLSTKKKADIFSETNEETILELRISGKAAECHCQPNMYATVTQIPQMQHRAGCYNPPAPIILERNRQKRELSVIKRNLADSEMKVEDLTKISFIEERKSIAIQKAEEKSNTPTICSPDEGTPQDKYGSTRVGILPTISPFCKLIALKNRQPLQNIEKTVFHSTKYRPKIKVLFNNIKLGEKPFPERQAMTDRQKPLQNGTLLTSFSITSSEDLAHFVFYIKRLGNPRYGTNFLRLYPARPFVSPGHVVALAKRFGVSAFKEPDLMWIFHQFLCAPQPNFGLDIIEEAQVEKMVEDTLSLKLGKHPSDIYFLYLLHYAHKEKRQELALVSDEEEMYQYLLQNSWLEFRGKESVVAYNFANMRHINRDAKNAEEGLEPKVGIRNKDTMEQIKKDFEKAFSLLQNYKVSDYVKHKLHRAKNFLIQDKTNSSSQKNTQIKAEAMLSLREYARSQLTKFERSLSVGRNPIISSHTNLKTNPVSLPYISETKRSHSLLRKVKLKH